MTADSDEPTCNTRKDQYVEKHRTGGIIAGVYNCGIVLNFRELLGCESISQVYAFLADTVRNVDNLPTNIGYDDACHLKKFAQNEKRANQTKVAKAISEMEIRVDKMHFTNHVDRWCQKNCNPHDCPAFDGINTEVCEQTFYFLSKLKHGIRHMNKARYNLFLYYVFNLYNEMKLR